MVRTRLSKRACEEESEEEELPRAREYLSDSESEKEEEENTVKRKIRKMGSCSKFYRPR
jgi:hypothetical protein